MMGFGRRERRLPGGRAGWRPSLLTNAQFVDDGAIPLEIGLLEVVEKAAAASYHFQESAPAVMIFRVGFEMLGQIRDAARQQCNLHLRRSSIAVVRLVLSDEL